MTDPHLYDLPTPALILDLDRIERNCERMIARAADLGVKLRPHMKTAKSADVARLATRQQSVGITVSTLTEIDPHQPTFRSAPSKRRARSEVARPSDPSVC